MGEECNVTEYGGRSLSMHNELVLCGQLKLRIRIPLRIVMVYVMVYGVDGVQYAY